MSSQYSSATFIAKSSDFEGPLDALLDLFEKKKLSISTISLKDLVDDFAIYIHEVEYISHDELLSLMYVLSLLILAKSSFLLGLSSEEDEELQIITQKLEILSQMRKTVYLIQKMSKHNKVFLPKYPQKLEASFKPDLAMHLGYMTLLVKNVLTGEVKQEREEIVHRKVIVKKAASTADIKRTILMATSFLFENRKRLSFSEVFAKLQETLLHPDHYSKEVQKKHVAVSFVSILEEVRHGDFDLELIDGEYVIVRNA